MFSNGPVPRFCFPFELFFKTVQLFLFSYIPVANEVSPVLVLIIGEHVDLTQFAHNVFFSELEKRCRCFLYVFVVFVGMEENATLCVQGLVPKSVPAHCGLLHHGPISFGIFCNSWNPFAALAKSATQCTILCQRLSHFLFMLGFFVVDFGRSFG